MLLGRRQQAVAAAREGLDAFQQTGAATSALGNAQVLNGVAYFRAVAQLELDEALPQITEAIQLLGGQPRIFMDYAYLCFLQEQYPLTLKMLSAAEQIYTDRRQNQMTALESAESLVNQEDIRSRLRDLQKSLARVLYYRLLVVRKQVGQLRDRLAAIPPDDAPERKQLAQQLADKQSLAGSVETRLADELESSVEVWEKRPLPTKQDLVETMRLYAMVIDTRGFLYYQREEYAAAFQDVRLAVQIGESVASEWLSIQRGKETDLRQLERERRSFCRSLATIRYHRLLVALRLKANSMADEDRQRIEELGHQPTPELF
jgi:tetratricopeptide (TPR) repeat protein